jgi:hypothetical protein
MNNPENPKDTSKEPDQAGGRLEHLKVHREASDVGAGWIIAVVSAVPVLAVIGFILVWTFFNYTERQEQKTKFSKYPLAPAPSSDLPKEPRLEPLNRLAGDTSANDFDRQLSQESRLTTFGSTPEKGFIRIPIQDAIKLVIPRLHSRPQPAGAVDKDNGLRYGGGPNSGRVFEENTP